MMYIGLSTQIPKRSYFLRTVVGGLPPLGVQSVEQNAINCSPRGESKSRRMTEEEGERREIEEYLSHHHLQSFLGDAVNDVVKERPRDPLLRLGDALRASSEAFRQIQGVKSRQILNGEALPALQIEISTYQVCIGATLQHDQHLSYKARHSSWDMLQTIMLLIDHVT